MTTALPPLSRGRKHLLDVIEIAIGDNARQLVAREPE